MSAADLSHQVSVLWRHVELRPLDIDAYKRLAFLTYEQKDFLTSLRCIKRTLQIYAEETKGDSHGYRTRSISIIDMENLKWKQAKCLLRRWMRYGDASDLDEACANYRIALRNRNVKMYWETYFEIASILLRLGDTQGCLDAYGACIVVFHDRRELLLVTEYNIAQVLVANGKLNEALTIYRELMLLTGVGNLTSADFIPVQCLGIKSLNISLEIARILYKKGEKELARSSFQELWEKFLTYDQPKIVIGGYSGFDLLMGHVSFNKWMADPTVWKRIADYFKKDRNYVFSAEFYENSAEILSLVGWERLPRGAKQMLIEVLLLRAECMREICKNEQAETLALTAYNMMPLDPVVIGRAARCCKSTSDEVSELKEKANHVMKYFVELYALLRMNAYRGRRRNIQFINRCATKINSIIRMALVRNCTAELRLSGVKIKRILPLVYSFRNLFKTGSVAVKNWVEVWNICASTIQDFFQR
jgi:tetratricopeptide (TPR) repeat protein